MAVAHAHHSLIDIYALLVESTKLETMHHVIIGALRIEVACALSIGSEWCDTICQSFSHHIVAKVDITTLTNSCSHVDGAFPVTLSQHLQNHQVAFVECTLACKRDNHAVGNAITCHHHTTLAYCLLVDSHIECVGWNDVEF